MLLSQPLFMAKKKEVAPSLIDTFGEFQEMKNINLTTMVGVLEESFRSVIAKIYGSDEGFNVIVNPDKGDFEIYRDRVVVADDEVTDENKEIPLSEAQKIAEDYEVGEEVTEKIDFLKFGRRAILTLRQTLASKILELEHDALYNKYADRVGEMISAEVYQTWKSEALLLDEDGIGIGDGAGQYDPLTGHDQRCFQGADAGKAVCQSCAGLQTLCGIFRSKINTGRPAQGIIFFV